jgi:hypothetical protein
MYEFRFALIECISITPGFLPTSLLLVGIYKLRNENANEDMPNKILKTK